MGALGLQGVQMNIDLCVWLFFIFLLFAPLHLSHIFLSSDPSSKSILWYKISHHLIHSTEITQLPWRHLPRKVPLRHALRLAGKGLAH